MKIIDIIGTASSNMFRSKLRTSLTIVAIFIGAFTLTLTNGLGSGISAYIDKQVGNLGAEDLMIIQPAGDDVTGLSSDRPRKYDPNKRTTSIESEGNRTVTVLTDKDIEKIESIFGIKSAEPYITAAPAYISAKSKDKFVGSISPHLAGANLALDAGRLPNNDATELETVIPSSYLEVLGFKSADEALDQTARFGVIDSFGKTTEVSAAIIGVTQRSLAGGNSIITNTSLVAKMREIQTAGLPEAATSTFQMATARFDPELSDAEITALKNRLKAAGYNGITIEDQIGLFKAVISGIVTVLNGFAVIALVAAGFGIINTLLMSVQERTKEIGLMKAMGMGGGRIFLLFSGEAVMIGFWGSLLGSILAIGVGSLLNQLALTTFLKDLEGLQLLTFSPASVLTIMGIVMTIAFLAGTLPAVRAARQNPIDSLRYE
jgi:putative ABC transport system permease protein